MYSSGGAYGVVREEGTSWIANNISQINLNHQWSGGCYSQINLTSELMREVYEKEITSTYSSGKTIQGLC